MRPTRRTVPKLIVLVALAAATLVAGAGPGSAGASCFGRLPTIQAVPGEETVGTDGPDVIIGTSGSDIVDGGGGDDRICSLGGADRVVGGAGADRIDLGSGTDVGRGGGGADRILGKAGNDHLLGNGANDVLVGGSDADDLDGGKKADTLLGGRGRDALYGRSGADPLDGQAGTDRCYGGPGPDELSSCELPESATGGGGGTSTPSGPLGELYAAVEADVIGVYGGSAPWLSQAWDHVTANGTVTIDDLPGGLSGQVSSSCSYSTQSLGSCDGVTLTIDEAHLGSANTYIHELAHVYERSTGILSDPGPLGMTQLYFNVEWGHLCNPAEIFADTMLHLVKPNAWLGYYAGGCPDLAAVTSTPTAQAEAVVTAMLAGQDPAWFANNYANGAQAWAAIMDSSISVGDRLRIVTNLAGEFGGYCSANAAMMAAFWGSGDPNPWRDDPC